MKTFIPKVDSQQRKWFLIDLDGVVLGRAAREVVRILRGKDKTIFTPHLDTGDNVIAVNASKVRVTGNKAEYKTYYSWSGYPGGLKKKSYSKMMSAKPTFAFEHAVKGMLPKNRLGRKMFMKLHVYADDKHPHMAQKPEVWKLIK